MKRGMLDDYFQLKNEWAYLDSHENSVEFRHRYSKQIALQLMLVGIPMQHLEHFTDRQNYSFPYCPRIYKCSIIANYCTGNEMRVDVALFSQKLLGSFAELSFHFQRSQLLKKLERQLVQLTQGFEYLFRRFGPFSVDQRLISWNSCAMVKVWLNKDALSQQIQSRVDGEKEMVHSLVKVLQSALQLRFWNANDIASFEALIDCVQNDRYDRICEHSRKVKFRAESAQTIGRQQPQSTTPLLKSINNILCIDSDGQQPRSTKQLQPVTFQFDHCIRRGRLSSQKSASRRKERSLTQKPAERVWTITLGEDAKEKQNVKPIRRQSKTLTCLRENPPEQRHSRRYSNSRHQEPPDILFHTQQYSKNSQNSLLRIELQSDLDGLFHSSEEELSFDAGELQRELQGVL